MWRNAARGELPSHRTELFVGQGHPSGLMLILHSGRGSTITTFPSLKGKELPYPGHFQELEILGVEPRIKHTGRTTPKPLRGQCGWSSFASFLPRQEERGGDAVELGLRHMAVPAAPHLSPRSPSRPLMPAP